MAQCETLRFIDGVIFCFFCQGVSAYLPIVLVIQVISTRELLGENKSDVTEVASNSMVNDLKYLDSFQLQ